MLDERKGTFLQRIWILGNMTRRAKRVCVGKVDPVTGDIVPTRGRAEKHEDKNIPATSQKKGPKPFVETRHLYYGATYLLDKLAEKLGLTDDLKLCFPHSYKKLLSIAYYLIREDNNPLYRFEKWNFTHKNPYASAAQSIACIWREVRASVLLPEAGGKISRILRLSSILRREHVKFLVGVKLSLKFIKKNFDEVYDNIRMFSNYDDSIATYGYTVSTDWDYTRQRPYKGDVIRDKRRLYIRYYYSIEKGADDEQFFEVKITPKRGRQISYKEDAIKEARKYFGYFALM